jgi:hypothetical protein
MTPQPSTGHVGTVCDTCGDHSDSKPDLPCGRLVGPPGHDDDHPNAVSCPGTYRIPHGNRDVDEAVTGGIVASSPHIDEDNPHENVCAWQVRTDVETDEVHSATIGKATVYDLTTPEHRHVAEVSVFVSLTDGAIVVQVDTHGEEPVPVRVYVNDGDVHNTGTHTVFDASVE